MTIKSRLQNLLTTDPPAAPAPAPAATINLDRSFATRAVQLQAATSAADERLAAARAASQRALQEAERVHVDAVRALAQTDRATRAMLRASLVRDALEAFAPLISSWTREPSRATALSIIDTLVALVRRELTELGPSGPRPSALLALTHSLIDSVAAGAPSVLVALSSDAGWTSRLTGGVGSVMGRAVMIALEGRAVSGQLAQTLLAELESAIEAIAAATQDRPLEARTRARWQVVKTQDPAALAAFDAELAREQAQVTEAACRTWGDAIRAQNTERASHSLGGDVAALE